MSRLPPLRIRARLALWYLVSIVPMLLAYAMVMAWFVHHEVRDEIDTRLKLDLSAAVDKHLLQWGTLPPNTSIDWLESADPRQAFIDSWRIDVQTAQPTLRQRIRGTASQVSLPPPDMRQRDGVPFNSTTGNWRMVQGHAELGEYTLVIRAALPLAPLDQTMHNVLTGSGLGVLVVLAIASVGGFWIAGTALQPITQLIRRTREIGPSSLSERLPVTSPPDEMAELAEVINGLLTQVQDALDRQGRFATEAAHELRTPLTAQRSVGELALRHETSASDLRNAVASMLEEGHHMQKVIDGLLTLARADTGRLVTQVHPVQLAELLEQTVPSLLPLAEEREQLLTWRCERPVVAYADEALLRQVMLNLVHNSINHCGAGTRIAVQVSSTPTAGILSIIDNGPGMEPPGRDEMFQRKSTRHASVRGLGLGLSIAKALVRAQGATLVIDSEPGLGTRIHIRLPRVQDASITTRPPSPAEFTRVG
ncbi:MAG: HAMP domain-containing sensor histidine kinase [Pseudomonadota bacterium]